MKAANIIAGAGVTLAGYGFAAVSGKNAYDGILSMTDSPALAAIGPLSAVLAASFGIVTETAVKERNRSKIVLCALACVASAGIDAYFGESSLAAIEARHEAAYASSLASFETASAQTAAAQALIKRNDDFLATLSGPDVKAAQRLLGVKPDGEWGPITTGAREAREAVYRQEIADARADIRAAAPVVSEGRPLKEASKSLPSWIALLITGLAVVCSFWGSAIMFGLKPEEDKQAAEAAMNKIVEDARKEVQARTGVLRAAADAIRNAA